MGSSWLSGRGHGDKIREIGKKKSFPQTQDAVRVKTGSGAQNMLEKSFSDLRHAIMPATQLQQQWETLVTTAARIAMGVRTSIGGWNSEMGVFNFPQFPLKKVQGKKVVNLSFGAALPPRMEPASMDLRRFYRKAPLQICRPLPLKSASIFLAYLPKTAPQAT